jgi:threonine dehydrogenase-like Zn-dependent dehydrogenase
VYDAIGMQDFTTDDAYFERGISRLHGFLTEEYVDSAEWIVKLPPSLSRVGVLLEPMTVVEKGIAQAYEAQRRLRVWRPRRAAVLGAGTIGLMATLVLRLRGLAVDTFALTPKPNVNASLVEATGARYVCGQDRNVVQAAESEGGYDLVFECSGFSPLVFDGMRALAKNGALVLSSITGGQRTVEIPSDAINQAFVLGNKLMLGTVNAGRADFEQGVRDLVQAEAAYPGWLEQLLTHPVRGLENWPMLFEALNGKKGVIKAFLEVRAS